MTPYPVPPKLTAQLAKMSRDELVAQILEMYQLLREKENPRPPAERCFYCGEPTVMGPMLNNDVEPPTVHPPCCWLCTQMGLWDPVPMAECSPEMLERAKRIGSKI